MFLWEHAITGNEIFIRGRVPPRNEYYHGYMVERAFIISTAIMFLWEHAITRNVIFILGRVPPCNEYYHGYMVERAFLTKAQNMLWRVPTAPLCVNCDRRALLKFLFYFSSAICVNL